MQTLINEVRRLGAEQHTYQQEIRRLQEERFPFGEVPHDPEEAQQHVPAASADTRIGRPPVLSSDESTWSDWSFKLRSYVSVVDVQLGRMMDEAELQAHASAWIPSELPSEDMDAQLRYLLVTLTSGSALQIIRQQPSGVQAFRDLAGRYHPRSQARSLAQLQEIMQFDVGHDPSGVTDRLVVFERLIGEYETSSGEHLGVQVKCRVLLE